MFHKFYGLKLIHFGVTSDKRYNYIINDCNVGVGVGGWGWGRGWGMGGGGRWGEGGGDRGGGGRAGEEGVGGMETLIEF